MLVLLEDGLIELLEYLHLGMALEFNTRLVGLRLCSFIDVTEGDSPWLSMLKKAIVNF